MADAIGAIRVDASIATAEYVAGARKIKSETASLERDVKTRFAGMGAAVKGGIAGLVGALSVGAFVQIGRAALQYASSLGDVSQQLGVTTRDLQTLRYAAGQLGVSQSELDKGLENLTKTLGKVAVGAEKPAKALEAIGLNAQQIAQMDTGAAFKAIADALQNVTDRAQRAAVETALFGETGSKLDSMLAGGSEALNELGAAAEELGVVLSDEQIQKADETADKLEAMKTVLSARIAGVVADNADSILQLADALGAVVGAAAQAAGAMIRFYQSVRGGLEQFHRNNPGLGNLLFGDIGKPGPAKSGAQRFGSLFQGRPAAPRGVDVGNFLAKAPRSGGRRRTPRAPRDDSARDLYRFEQDELRAQADILRAKQQLSDDYVERTSLAIQILDLERASFQNDLEFQVGQKDLTQAQADQLQLLYDRKDALERENVLKEERIQAAKDSAQLDAVNLDLERDLLESQADLTETASEQRDVALRLLDLSYRQERARLATIIADETASEAAKEEARRRMSALNDTYGNARQSVINGTRGPLESYMASLPLTAAKMNEALQNVAANGLKSLEDGIMSVIDGTKSLGKAFRDVASSIISDLLRISIQKAIIGPLAGALFGSTSTVAGATGSGGWSTSLLPGLAGGGSFNILGKQGIDRNTLSLNGLPIANVSYGERLSVSNDNAGSSRSGGSPFIFNNYAPMSDAQARKTGMQAAAGFRAEQARSAQKGIS